ncbi:DUF4355 domain-containing protein [Liquorilactobacillus nagelii]|uniref:DUF4355 domain-containing protein n=1 Tax=Liquorilactobacillus nagelii TaxID=82688 RepID=UPI0006F07DFE|nr:DUF4355 domain-containing protein [Liquorilactobacillus nagelii]KRL40727.1 hypothetical protein FD45_GL001371 [Liquorilactobacillus nagelii DSM 13675]QYH53689.1 DUF4355 domain-containing protein [Liquorilactobacillus nagelii DSM 13675]
MNDKMKMNLQYFAEQQDDTADNSETQTKTEDNQQEQQQESTKKTKTFTQEEVNQMVNERLERERKAQEVKIQAAKDEAAKLAKMNADQKKEYQLQKQTERAEAAEAKLAKFEMTKQARSMMSEAGLNVTDDELDLVVTSDAESTQANVNQLISFADRVREAVKTELLKGDTPTESGKSIKTMTKAEILAIKDSFKRKKAIADNIQLFK